MSKFKFVCEESSYCSPASTTTVEVSAVLLDDVVNQFELFLRGCGFNFKGNLVILDDTEEDPANYYVDSNFDFSELPKNNWPFASNNVESSKSGLCNICKIDNETMSKHTCHDVNCPKGSNNAN